MIRSFFPGLRFGLLFACWTLVTPAALAQVQSYTLAVQAHCPYGIGVCWHPTKESLETMEGIELLSEIPDRRTSTCAVRPRDGRLIEPEAFTRTFAQRHSGTKLHGVEATILGSLDRKRDAYVLRVGGSDVCLALAPLREKVQRDSKTYTPQTAAKRERTAYKRLLAGWKGQARVEITGPLVRTPEGELALQVRLFTFHKPQSVAQR